jgi:hypothetical protein
LSLAGVEGYEGILYREGQPELPVLRFYTTGEVRVDAQDRVQGAQLAAGDRILPSQPPRLKLPRLAETLIVNDASYASTELAPAALYDVEPAGSINGMPRQLVTLYPVAYAPGSGQWAVSTQFTVKIRGEARTTDGPARDRYVFVVGSRFAQSPSLAAYMDLKRQLGYQVEAIVVEQGDTADTLRAKLKAQYARTDAKLRYALLVGDSADVPSKVSSTISGVTDHYYRAIDTDSYATDVDGPDIGVGRVAVQTEAQLAAVLDKFTRYQRGGFAQEGWLNEVSFLATDDQWQLAEGTHNYVIQSYTSPKAYTGDFPTANQPGGDQLYAVTNRASGSTAIEKLKLGRTIIDYSGHGSPTSWAGPSVSQSMVRSLTDTNALPFVIGNACNTGDFRTAESFGETWLRHPAGAIAYWGSMDSSYWDEDDLLERYMFDGIYREGRRTFSDITNYAQSELWRHYGGAGKSKYYWETYVVFGDPALDLRTTATRHLTVEGPADLPVGSRSVTYTVRDEAGPVANARVALVLPSADFQMAGVTDAEGQITIDINAAARAPVTFDVSVSGQNLPLTATALHIVNSTH